MKVSEIDLDIAKRWWRIDGNQDDLMIQAVINGAIRYCKSYTGLSDEDMDTYEDMAIAVLSLGADMYDLRQASVSGGVQVNPTVAQILGSYSRNLL